MAAQAQDTALESTEFNEETPIEEAKEDGATTTNGNEDDGPAKQTDQESEIQRRARAIASTTGYNGKYNWDANNKKNEKATVVPSSGAIVDYAWCDGKKSVSIYIALTGLDEVQDDDMKVSLVNDGEGVLFKAKNVTGKNRFLKIDKLHKKVKSTKLLRKRGQDKVIIKLVKDDEKRKWYNLKEGSSSSYGDDDYDWNDDHDDWIPPEDEEAMDDVLSGGMDNDEKEEAGETEEVDAPMENDAEEITTVGESETDAKDAEMTNE